MGAISIPESAALPPPKVLLVDDVSANLTALAAVFEEMPCELVFAGSGEEALRALLQDDFAAILLDVQMPGLDGFETAAMIRRRARSRHVPIFFLTAYSKEREAILEGYGHGAVDYLVKPFHPEMLRSKVAVFLEMYQRRELARVRSEDRLRSANLELAAALEAKDEFVAGASHELRTPLAAAKAQIQLAQRRIQPNTDDRIVRALATVGSQIDRMTRRVEDLLDLGRLRTGRLSLQIVEFDLVERIGGEIECMQALVSTHTFSLEAPPSLMVAADRDRLEQVIVNLLTNAVRYSPGGGPVSVRVVTDGNSVRLSVSDRGIGVPLEKQETIFERFGRAHGARYGGLGLGLTIAQGITEQHGGRIWVESSGVSGEGSTFFVEIPIRATARLSAG